MAKWRVNKLGYYRFGHWLVACFAPIHDLKQCWFTVNWTAWNIFRWDLNPSLRIFIQKKYFRMCLQNGDHFVCESSLINVMGPSYFGFTRSISRRLMPWLLTSPRHQQPCYFVYVEYVGHCLTWGRILSTCVISIWKNDIICKYMFMLPLKKLAHKRILRKWVDNLCHRGGLSMGLMGVQCRPC